MGKERGCLGKAGDYTANPGSDLSPRIPPFGAEEGGQVGAMGWIPSSSLSNWVKGIQAEGEAGWGCWGQAMLGMGGWEMESEGQDPLFIQWQALCQALAMCYLLNPPKLQPQK